ncbi:YdcF family protein, partial [Thermobifida halotolerans]
AERVWNYHQMNHDLRPVDAAVVLGCHDLGVATCAAKLYHAGFFPRMVFTGGNSPSTAQVFPRGEAVHYREHALALGVPDEAILVEPDAANTGQNIAFSRQVLAEAGLHPATVMLVTMPYMQRRGYATTRRVWPEVEAVCASEPVAFRDYLAGIGDDRLVIDTMVGDLQRIIEYPGRGFAVAQHVPDDVHTAYQALIEAGFTSRLIGA